MNRRGFLKSLGITGVGIAVLPVASRLIPLLESAPLASIAPSSILASEAATLTSLNELFREYYIDRWSNLVYTNNPFLSMIEK